MREIKFRAWNKVYKKYVEINELEMGVKSLAIKFITPSGRTLYLEHGNSIILEQYTGLKDKNDVEIYEGDLVKEHWQKEPSVIVYFAGAYGFFDSYNNFHHLSSSNELASIVGNIHDKENK